MRRVHRNNENPLSGNKYVAVAIGEPTPNQRHPTLQQFADAQVAFVRHLAKQLLAFRRLGDTDAVNSSRFAKIKHHFDSGECKQNLLGGVSWFEVLDEMNNPGSFGHDAFTLYDLSEYWTP